MNFGFTNITVKVCSPDKSNTQFYVVEIFRSQIPKLCSFTQLDDKIEYEDSLSLGPIYGACNLERIKGQYSYPFVEFFYKISQHDQMNMISLHAEHSNRLEPSLALESRMSNSTVRIPCVNGGMQNFEIKQIKSLK